MSKVFKPVSEKLPKSVAPYERSALEEILDDAARGSDPAAVREHILAEARRQAEQKVREAYNEGYRRGFESAQADFRGAVRESAAALKCAAHEIQRAREQFCAALEPQVVDLALRIAERILHREALTDRNLVLQTAREAIAHLVDRENIVLRINPLDWNAIRSEKLRLAEEFDGIARIHVEADEHIAPGGCIAESSFMQVDARLDAQLEAILDGINQPNGRTDTE